MSTALLWGTVAYSCIGPDCQEPPVITEICDPYVVDGIPDGFVYNGGTYCSPCPAGYYCTGGNNRGKCGNGKCAANDNGECVPNGATKCITCSGDTPYSNEQKTECKACDNDDEYVVSNVCYSCDNDYYNDDLYTAFKIPDVEGVRACGVQLRGDLTDDCASKLTTVQWQYDSRTDTKWRAYRIVVDDGFSDFEYVKVPTANQDSLCGTCPLGTINANHGVGENSCQQCPAGYCKGPEKCELCPAGRFCPLNDDGEIYSCADINSNDVFKCKKGSFSQKGQATCTRCAAGYTTYDTGTAYIDNNNSNNICIKIQVGLNSNNNVLPPNILNQGDINNSVVQQQ